MIPAGDESTSSSIPVYLCNTARHELCCYCSSTMYAVLGCDVAAFSPLLTTLALWTACLSLRFFRSLSLPSLLTKQLNEPVLLYSLHTQHCTLHAHVSLALCSPESLAVYGKVKQIILAHALSAVTSFPGFFQLRSLNRPKP